MAMTFKITCDRDGATAEGSIALGTTFMLPPGWANMNIHRAPEEPKLPPPLPVVVVLCPSCVAAIQAQVKGATVDPTHTHFGHGHWHQH